MQSLLAQRPRPTNARAMRVNHLYTKARGTRIEHASNIGFLGIILRNAVLSGPRVRLVHWRLLRRHRLPHGRRVHLLPLRIAHLHRTARHVGDASSVQRWRLLRRRTLRWSHVRRGWLAVHRCRLDAILRDLGLVVDGVHVRVFGGVVAGRGRAGHAAG